MDISGTKKRLLLLLEYLYKNTDEEHQATENAAGCGFLGKIYIGG